MLRNSWLKRNWNCSLQKWFKTNIKSSKLVLRRAFFLSYLQMEKIDILAMVAHPDDVELSTAGTLIAHIKQGYTAGIVDLTKGEMGTRGTPEQRLEEADAAAKIMGLKVRENLGLEDAFFQNDKTTQLQVIQAIRKYQPEIIIANAEYDRHPDHGRAAKLVEESAFKAGLRMIETYENGELQAPWRPKKLYHMIQSVSIEPDFIVDISEVHDTKLEAIRAFKSQFFDPNSAEPETYISKPEFMNMIEARAIEYGHRIGAQYGEGFTQNQFLGVKDLFHFI